MLDFLFVVDLKYRDFETIFKIANYLKINGYKSILCNGRIDEKFIISKKPKYIVIPDANWNPMYTAKCRISGIKIIVIETEGNPQDSIYVARKILIPDIHIFWSKSQSDLYNYPKSTVKKVLGYHRGDLLWDFYINKKRLDKTINKKNRLTITIATAAQDTHLSLEEQKEIAIKRARKRKIGTAYNKVLSSMNEQKEIITKYLFDFSRTNIPHLIILKPHPHEKIAYWSNLINQIDDKRIKILLGKPINSLLQLSNIHIAFAGCSTIAESMLIGLPTIQLRSSYTSEITSDDHFYISDYIADKSDDIFHAVESTFNRYSYESESEINTLSPSIMNYVKKYFTFYDGNRCKEYANFIHNELTRNSKRSLSKEVVLNYLFAFWLFYFIKWKRFISKIIFLIKGKKILNSQENKQSNELDERYGPIGEIIEI